MLHFAVPAMKFSRKAEYALRAMLAMCRAAPGTVFSIQSLATKERIPLKFLEQILLVLRKGGVLHSRRGAGGGYQLAQPANRITLREILELVDGPLELMPQGVSMSHGMTSIFKELQGDFRALLAKHTLADVLLRDQARGAVSFEI
jgi:Rrf2 family protein